MNIRHVHDEHLTYLKQKEYIGSSSIKMAAKSDLEYMWNIDNSAEPTSSQSFGTALHMAVLEPDLFEKYYFTIDDDKKPVPEATWAKAENKAYKEQILLENSGKEYLALGEFKACQTVTSRLRKDFRAHINLEPAIKESSFYADDWYGDADGVLNVKVRPDFFKPDLLGDVKTTKAPDPKGFYWEFFKYGYDVQLALYRDVLRDFGHTIDKVTILAVGNGAPFCHEWYTIPEDILQKGKEKYLYGLSRIVQIKNGNPMEKYSLGFRDEDDFIILDRY
jgi:hypothetical protein